MTQVRCDGLTVNFRPILRLIVVASASRAPPMTIQTESSGVFSILGVARPSAARRLAPKVRKRGAREDEVSGTTRPFRMTRAQHSRIAVNTASMAALIFNGRTEPLGARSVGLSPLKNRHSARVEGLR
jgi:hypothetical protein